MPSGCVTESESRVARKLSTFTGAKDTYSRDSRVSEGRVGTESEVFGAQYLVVNMELRYSTFSQAESVWCYFEERKGMEEEHPPETDLTRCHHVLEEGDQFESSFLRLDRCFLALLRVDPHL